MQVNVETDLVHQRSFFHRELNFVYLTEIRVRNLMVLDNEVAESDEFRCNYRLFLL